ncbi:hypothetical protein B0I37DRAFT_376555 [Chaetomium sp. MPI-CAGE-AT-0009]|nr:hypothetical protein B0I37DRAFT_376555 [Chaetomium sp. MPI-CAGE-AT-0009]
MDWPDAENPRLLIEGEYVFEFDENSKYTSRVLRNCNLIPGESRLDLRSDAQWDEWLESSVLKLPTNGQDRSGYHILLSARVNPVQETPTEIAAGLEYLPFEENHWRALLRHAPFHNVIRNAITKGKNYSTCLVSDIGKERVELYTAAMSSEWPNNLAISSAHFRQSNFTIAVIYGCRGIRNDGKEDEDGTPNHMERVEELLARSPEVKGHPLLMPGIFEELQRDRIEGLVRMVEDELDMMMSELKINQSSESPELKQLNWAMSRKLGRFRLKAKKVEEEARTSKENLKKMMDHIETSTQGGYWPENAGNLNGSKHDSFKKSTKRFKDRFAEIHSELDSMIVRCRVAFEEVTYARELFMAELARQEAEESKRQTQHAAREAKKTTQQARTSTVIAFVAMLYLPATSMATIFAMPVLKFDNDWWDARFRDAPSGENPDGGDGSARPPSPVFSAYFWIYLLLSAAFTVATLLAWRVYTKESEDNGGGNSVEQKGSSAGSVPKSVGDSPIGPGGGSSSASSPVVEGWDAITRRPWGKLRSMFGGYKMTKEVDPEIGMHSASLKSTSG